MAAHKLDQDHVDQICRLSAAGTKATEITVMLAEGLETGTGSTLAPVDIDASSVRRQIRVKSELVTAWRAKLYGSAMLDPMGWPGYRMQQIRKIHDRAIKKGDDRLALKCVTEARAEVAQLAERTPTQHAHLHLHGDDRPQLVSVLGARLFELSKAGLLGDAAEILGANAPELEAEVIEVDAVGASEAEAQTVDVETLETPRPPPTAPGAEGR